MPPEELSDRIRSGWDFVHSADALKLEADREQIVVMVGETLAAPLGEQLTVDALQQVKDASERAEAGTDDAFSLRDCVFPL